MMDTSQIQLPSYLDTFDPRARVWVYQSSRPFTSDESDVLHIVLQDFTRQWTAHNRQLKAAGLLLFNRIIILVVDETQAGASGCSIDSSVHFIQSLEKQYAVELFDRMIVNYLDHESCHSTTLTALSTLTSDALVFDPLVTELGQLRTQGINKIGNTWMASFLVS